MAAGISFIGPWLTYWLGYSLVCLIVIHSPAFSFYILIFLSFNISMEESITTADWDVDIHNAEMTCMTMIMERIRGDSGKGKRFEKCGDVGIIYLYRGLKEAPRTQGIQLINKDPYRLFWFVVSHMFHK